MGSVSEVTSIYAAYAGDNIPLDHRWSLDLPGGPIIDVFNIGGRRSQISGIASEGSRHQRVQHRWWALPDLLHCPLLVCIHSDEPAVSRTHS
jgi:hypothetical protein